VFFFVLSSCMSKAGVTNHMLQALGSTCAAAACVQVVLLLHATHSTVYKAGQRPWGNRCQAALAHMQ
jgi:hypothetical protein